MPTNAYQLGRSISVARIERIDTGAEIIPKATSDGLAMTMLTDPAGLRQVGPVARSLSPRIYNTTLVLADTEYSQALASGLKRLLVCTQDLTAFRVAFQTGLVAAPTAPYLAVPASTGPLSLRYCRASSARARSVFACAQHSRPCRYMPDES